MEAMTTFLNKFVLKTIKTAMTTEVLSHRIIKIFESVAPKSHIITKHLFSITHCLIGYPLIFLIHFLSKPWAKIVSLSIDSLFNFDQICFSKLFKLTRNE